MVRTADVLSVSLVVRDMSCFRAFTIHGCQRCGLARTASQGVSFCRSGASEAPLSEKRFEYADLWYSFLSIPSMQLDMIREHEARRKAVGERPAYYFVDVFVLNQHQLFKNCTSDVTKREMLVTSLKNCLVACGHTLLCCSAGHDGHSGWESPAVLGRIWYVRQVTYFPQT